MSGPDRGGSAPVLRVQRLDGRAQLPRRAHRGDAGLDLCSIEAVTLQPGARASLRTGLAVEIPYGQAGLVLPRSGLARRHGVTLVNSPGLIDAGFRGELEVLVVNTDRATAVQIEVGERIAQLVLVTVSLADVVEADELSESTRGNGGFGSSGRH